MPNVLAKRCLFPFRHVIRYSDVLGDHPKPMKLPPLSVFALDQSDDGPTAFLGDTELEVIDIAEDEHIIAGCDYAALSLASLDAFPDALCIKVHSPDGFGTFLFHEAEIFKNAGGSW